MELPGPEAGRWRPLRIDLVDLFYRDIEEFHLYGGSLLLRGNNGTGKSKVLALTMPFLLDGELAPHRVEPDGEQAYGVEPAARRWIRALRAHRLQVDGVRSPRRRRRLAVHDLRH
jgi:hypothetical protein